MERGIEVGSWAVCPATYGGRTDPDILQVDKVTAHRVVSGRRHIDRSSVMATFATKDEATKLVQRIASVAGESKRRIRAAREWAEKEVDAAIARALGTGEGSSNG